MDSKNLLKELLKDIADLFTLNERMINRGTPEKFQVDRARQKAKNLILAYDKLSEMLNYSIPNSHLNTEFELIANFIDSESNISQFKQKEETKIDISELTAQITTLVKTLVARQVTKEIELHDKKNNDLLNDNSEIAFNDEFKAFEESILDKNIASIDNELNTEIPIVEDYFKDELSEITEYLVAPSREMSNCEKYENKIPIIDDYFKDELSEMEYIEENIIDSFDDELNTEIPMIEDYFEDELAEVNTSELLNNLQKNTSLTTQPEKQEEIEKDINIELKLDSQEEYERQTLAMEKLLNFGTSKENNKPINRIIEEIGLNERFVFISDLFNNDTSAFYHAVQSIDQMTNYEDASNYLKKFNWDSNINSYKEFMILVNRRFINQQKK